jgi:hypothetical protein
MQLRVSVCTTLDFLLVFPADPIVTSRLSTLFSLSISTLLVAPGRVFDVACSMHRPRSRSLSCRVDVWIMLLFSSCDLS